MIPGSNLLRQALTVIARQSLYYYQATGRTVNDIGQQVTTYAARQLVYGSFQPVPKNLYQQFGLDLQKQYFIFYSLNDVIDVRRDVSNDQLQFNGQRFQCESSTEWYALDGWKGVLCCLIDGPTVVTDIFGFNNLTPYVNFENGNFYDVG